MSSQKQRTALLPTYCHLRSKCYPYFLPSLALHVDIVHHKAAANGTPALAAFHSGVA